MILKFFGTGTGNGKSAIRYLLQDREPSPKVLRGDPDITQSLIASLDFKWCYKSGVIAFDKNERVTNEIVSKAMDSFEHQAFAGMASDACNILWVMHREKGNVELHFVIPRVDLRTGKSFNPCPPGKFYKAQYRSFVESFTKEYSLINPYEKKKELNLVKARGEDWMTGSRKEIRAKLHNDIRNAVLSKKLSNRDAIISYIKESGHLITRAGKDYITVKIIQSDTRIRLKGELYNEDFSYKQWVKDRSKSIRRQSSLNQLRAKNILFLEIAGLFNERKYQHVSRGFREKISFKMISPKYEQNRIVSYGPRLRMRFWDDPDWEDEWFNRNYSRGLSC